ncbi:hypothetical protein BJV77DRAFT_32839 [Russula vinacea]|nr:hypothetical protein BJV77DRAFT_32839 [Russula vinacea]
MTQWEDRPTNNGISPFSLEARDEDYDVYLFWPSLSSGMESSETSFVATQHSPMPPLFDRIDYYSGWDTVPSSPLPLTSPSDFRFPTPCEDQAIDNGSLVVEVQANGVQERVFPQGYSNMFRMGLLFMQAARHVDRAVQSVGITLRKTKPKAREVETFNR